MATAEAAALGGDWAALLERIKDGDDSESLEPLAHQLYAAGLADPAEAAAVITLLLQELPPESGRVLRRVLLSDANAQFEAAADDGAKRPAVCSLLCELYLADAIPETVIFDCLEQLLWDIKEPLPADIDCAVGVLQSVGEWLDGSELDAADMLMDDLFARLKEVCGSGALPYDQDQAVRALLRQREAGWKEVEAVSAASPVLALPPKGGGSEEAEDWRAVLDRKAAAAGVPAGVQDSARGSLPQEAAEAGPAQGEQQSSAAPAAMTEPQVSLQEQKRQAVQAVVAAAPAAAPWDVPTLVQAVRGHALDLSAPPDAERLVSTLLDHAVASAAAGSAGGELEPLRSLPPAVVGCAALLAELSGQAPAVAEAAAAQVVAYFRKRTEARSREARAQLGHQMLLAGSLAQRGVVPEAQLQTMLEQLARQVMKPTAADVVCLCSLLRGAGAASESKKGQWWKAAGQLASSANVPPDQQRALAHLLVLREHKWDAAAAAAAAVELDARKKAEAAAVALEAATLQRQVQEEAAARAAAEVARADEQIKAAAARLAELEKQQAAAEAAAAKARQVAKQAEAAAQMAAERRAQEDRAASAARKAATDAQAATARAQREAADARASAAGGASRGGGSEGEGARLWHVAWASTAEQLPGPYTALELVCWLYQNPLLALELQVFKDGEPEQGWQRLQDRTEGLLAEAPPLPIQGGAAGRAPPPPPAPAGGRGGRGRRGGRGGRGGPPAEYAPPAGSPRHAGGRSGRGRGREMPTGRGGRGRGRGEAASYPQQAQQVQQYQAPQPPRDASPPQFAIEDMLPHLYVPDSPPRQQAYQAPAQPAYQAPRPGGGYNPLQQQQQQPAQQQQRQQQQQQPAAAGGRAGRSFGLCPSCFSRESAHIWLPCGHGGHCTDCLPDDISKEDKFANCPKCQVCGLDATDYMRVYP